MEKLLIRISGAADLLDVSSGTVRGLVRNGTLPSVRVGRAIRIHVAGLRQWADAQTKAMAAMYAEQNLLDRPVDVLGLSVRSHRCLKNAEIQTLGDLVQKTEAEMCCIKNFGRKSLNEIKEVLGGMGLQLQAEPAEGSTGRTGGN